jgi:hypothetical protein
MSNGIMSLRGETDRDSFAFSSIFFLLLLLERALGILERLA